MKARLYLTNILLVFGLLSFGQKPLPTNQSNNSLDFSNFLAGVKFASIELTPEKENYIKSFPFTGELLFTLRDRLTSMGFEYVALWSADREQLMESKSLCDIVNVLMTWNFDNSSYHNIRLIFTSCNKDSFEFVVTQNVKSVLYAATNKKFDKLLISILGYKKLDYNLTYRYSLNGEKTNWTESKLKEYFGENGIDAVEGIYESSVATENNPKYKLGLIKGISGYELIYLSGASNNEDWMDGDLKAKLISTATTTLFKTDWYMRDKSINNSPYLTFEQGIMNLFWSDRPKDLYIKLFPTSTDNISRKINSPASGSGFALTSDGYISTNQHVINGSSSIKVRGINGDFSKTYNARLALEDKNNDLAIIKIDDISFTSLGTVPYIINSRTSDVGTSVFVLGYPLRATMGDEIKLTSGIISAKSGFQGDITTYQITAPIQPGNSGGPLFDNDGNIIGIVNARHTAAENASYAIKTGYLLNLCDLLQPSARFPKLSGLNGKPITDQVKLLRNFVYIIEVQ